MSASQYTIIGFSGHQALSPDTRAHVRSELIQALSKWRHFLGVTSLAAGSDQIFAECVLARDNDFMAVIPCQGYENTFGNPADLERYRELLKSAIKTVQLPFHEPSEEAYWAAGKRIVDTADLLVAVWDGQPAGGLGGTADVVDYATRQNKEVLRIWPSTASRK